MGLRESLNISDWQCTNSPEGNWHECCVRHDWDYAEGVSKWVADGRLLKCITKKGHPLVAAAFWVAVTVGGWGPYEKHREARESEM